MDGKEDNHTGDGDGRREAGRKDIVVFRPERKIATADIDHAVPRREKGGPDIGDVVRGPVNASAEDHDWVDLADPM